MRKYFLLIVYVTGFFFTHYCVGNSSYIPSAERTGKPDPSLIRKPTDQTGKYSFYSKDVFFIADIDLEDDAELKAKIVPSGGLLCQSANLRRINETEMTEYSTLDRPKPSRTLFKLNRVFRL